MIQKCHTFSFFGHCVNDCDFLMHLKAMRKKLNKNATVALVCLQALPLCLTASALNPRENLLRHDSWQIDEKGYNVVVSIQ